MRGGGKRGGVIFKPQPGATTVQVGKILSVTDERVEIQLAKGGSALNLTIGSIVRAVREIKI